MKYIPTKSPQSAKVEIKINMWTDLMIQCDKIRAEQSGARRKRLVSPGAVEKTTQQKR